MTEFGTISEILLQLPLLALVLGLMKYAHTEFKKAKSERETQLIAFYEQKIKDLSEQYEKRIQEVKDSNMKLFQLLEILNQKIEEIGTIEHAGTIDVPGIQR